MSNLSGLSSYFGGRLILAVQLLGTLLILLVVPTNYGKALAFLVWWALTFRRITRQELVLFIVASIFFTFMNAVSLKQGVFVFRSPDLLGMPYYELFMWGFYLLHTLRMIGGPRPEASLKRACLVAIGYVLAFSLIPDQNLLLIVTACLLVLGLVFFHEPFDLAFTGYMIFIGALIEYAGVLSGQWHYPGIHVGGVPFWFITLWGGVGLLLRRLVLPVLGRI